MLSCDPQEFGGAEAESLLHKKTDRFARVTVGNKSRGDQCGGPAAHRHHVPYLSAHVPSSENGMSPAHLPAKARKEEFRCADQQQELAVRQIH